MSKVYGISALYAPVRKERSRTVVCYGQQPEPDGIHATWHEVYFYHKRDGELDMKAVKAAITEDINQRVRERITGGLTWNGKPVWLSEENQMNWKADYDRALQTEGATLPMKRKIGEQPDGTPVYHTFTSVNALIDFFGTWMDYKNQQLADGWAEKDSIDWSVYEKYIE